ncbi:MAG: DNA/RNA non-specific endonuclease [Spirosomataceae bacterium]
MKPQPNRPTLYQNGFNRFWFFLLITAVALVLYYKDKKHPFEAFKQDVASIFGDKQPDTTSPTLPKAHDDNEATDDRRGSILDKIESKTEDSPTESTQAEEKNSDDEESSSIFSTTTKPKASELEKYLPAHGANDEIVQHRAYILNYQEDYEQAYWVVHKLIKGAKYGKAKRARDFKPDPLVETGSALPTDYSRSGYDRGHLAPAGDFKYDQSLTYETFYMSNMSPQKPELNQHIWNDMENKIRDWAEDREELIIVTGPVLKKGLEYIGRQNKVAVPEQYYKIVYDERRQQAIAFLMKNEGSIELLTTFVVSIDDIERITGIDFFAQLPDALEKKIESQRRVNDWF